MTLTPAAPIQRNDYRADIDGLRAIAVLAVIVFHAFPTILPGGFVGVDIFFVISGYLISKHIWEELESDSFSIKTFYERRIRRIFPALTLVLFVSLAFGWIILSPGEYEQLGKHTAAGAGFVANLIYWREAGYFDNAADTKPLLHLWSLGIEEQFYIFWPLILIFLWRRPHHAWWALPVLLGSSLTYSLFLVQKDTVADFYSPLTRLWELGAGAVLAHHVSANHKLIISYQKVLPWLGLTLLGFSVIALNSQDAFPGGWAIFPVLGAVMLILSGADCWVNRNILSHRWMVWIGLISYPLYLWHWPLLSFARIMESSTPEWPIRLALLLASFVLAWLTYRFVERPIRSGPRSRRVLWLLSLLMILLLAAGETVRKLDGVTTRKLSMLNGDPMTLTLGADRQRLQNECGLDQEQKSLFEYCLQKQPDSPNAILGDSKAEALYYGLTRVAEPGDQWRMFGSIHPPALGITPQSKQERKEKIALDYILHDQSIRDVVIATALRTIYPVDKESGFITSSVFPEARFKEYSAAITQLEQAGKRVIFVIDNPTFPDPRSCISGGATSSEFWNQFFRRKENPYCTLKYSDHLEGIQAYSVFVERLKQAHPALLIFDPTPYLCDIPNNVCAIAQDGNFLYSYGDHISDYANTLLAHKLNLLLSNSP